MVRPYAGRCSHCTTPRHNASHEPDRHNALDLCELKVAASHVHTLLLQRSTRFRPRRSQTSRSTISKRVLAPMGFSYLTPGQRRRFTNHQGSLN